LGGIAGLAGGIVERAILAAADLFLSLPWLFLLLIARACLPLNVPAALSVSITFALLGLLGWAGPARVVRVAVLDLRNSDFVLFARASGCTFWRLLWAHVAPNVMPVLRAQFRIAVPVYILAETTLGMLGLGISEPLPSWGGLLRELEGADVPSRLWLLAPALLLAAVTVSLQLLRPDKDLAA
jgi:ABC-type dipeptide/oligopeptide/nickel transport system permease subunit